MSSPIDPGPRVPAPVPLPAPAPIGPSPSPPPPSDPGLVTQSNVPLLLHWVSAAVPMLARPDKIDADSLSALLGALNESITKEQVKTGTETIKIGAADREAMTKKVKEQMEIAAQKAKEAAEAAENNKIAGWCQAIFGLIGAVLGIVGAVFAAIGTAGAGTPLVVVAVIGAVLAVQDVANMAVKEAGVEVTNVNGDKKALDISFGGMIGAIVDQQLKDGTIVEIRKDASGNYIDKEGNVIQDPHLDAKPGAIFMDEKQLGDWKMGWTITTSLLIAAGTMATGVAGMAGMERAAKAAAKAGEGLSRAATAAERVTEGAQVAADLGQAASTGVQGGIGIKVADLNRDSDRARAGKAYYENMIKEIGMRMNMTQDMIRELVTRMNDAFDQMSASIAGTSTNHVTIARNMS